MGRIIKANWTRRLPPKPSYERTLEAEREYWRRERIDHVKSLAGSTERQPGTVFRIEKYGAFVEFKWGRGLVHISEMSKNQIRHPNGVVSLGQKVQVYVIAVDDRDRIGLSLIGRSKKKDIDCSVRGEYTAVLDRVNEARDDASDTPPIVSLPDKVTEGKQPIRGFSELAAYWRLKEGK